MKMTTTQEGKVCRKKNLFLHAYTSTEKANEHEYEENKNRNPNHDNPFGFLSRLRVIIFLPLL